MAFDIQSMIEKYDIGGSVFYYWWSSFRYFLFDIYIFGIFIYLDVFNVGGFKLLKFIYRLELFEYLELSDNF